MKKATRTALRLTTFSAIATLFLTATLAPGSRASVLPGDSEWDLCDRR